MAEPHYLSGGLTLPGSVGAVDDQFFRRYRTLLDAEDAAFDELEHAYEDGDRVSFESDLVMWHSAIARRTSFLADFGSPSPGLVL
jgi:hypothetical protein